MASDEAATAASAALHVEVAYAPGPRRMDLTAVTLPPGSTVAHALAASGVLARHEGLNRAWLAVGIWGRPVTQDDRVQQGDRIELYRPLQVDPKESRRLRYRAQGERGRRKPGMRAGR